MNIESLMQVSYIEAMQSPDPSTQLGAVLVDHRGYAGSIIGVGHNHFPSGVSSDFWHGEKQDKYNRVVHAEISAILNAAQAGHATYGSTLICRWAACSNCAKHIVEAGVEMLIRHPFEVNVGTGVSSWYDDVMLGDEIMRDAGVKIKEIPSVPLDLVLRHNGLEWRP